MPQPRATLALAVALKEIDRLEAQLAAQSKEMDSLREDAKRYRFIRNRNDPDDVYANSTRHCLYEENQMHRQWRSGTDLDSAIDAAIDAAKESK